MEEGRTEGPLTRDYDRELEHMLTDIPKETKDQILESLKELNAEQMVAVLTKAKVQFASKVASLIGNKFPDATKEKIDRVVEKKWKVLEFGKMTKFIINARSQLMREAEVGSAKREDPTDKKEENPFIAYLASKNKQPVAAQEPEAAPAQQEETQGGEPMEEEAPVTEKEGAGAKETEEEQAETKMEQE